MFRGFPRQGLAFFSGLEADNTKTYWHAHRDGYEDFVREPLELLVAELAPEFGAAKVFRPYRDVRFSRDKRPYKTAASAVARQDGHRAALRYVEFSAKGLVAGGGIWHMSKEQLDRARRAIDDDVHGPELERLEHELEVEGITYVEGTLKTAPRGYPRDHPRIELLRRQHHAALVVLPPAPWLHERKAIDHVTTVWRQITPLLDWLEHHAV